MAAVRHLGFFVRMRGTTGKVALVVFYHCAKFGLNPLISFDNIEVYFLRFGWKLPIYAPFLGRFGAYFPQMTSSIVLAPKGPSLRGYTSFQPWSVKIVPTVWPVCRIEKKAGQSHLISWWVSCEHLGKCTPMSPTRWLTWLEVDMSLRRESSVIVVPLSSMTQNILTTPGLAVTSHWITRMTSPVGVASWRQSMRGESVYINQHCQKSITRGIVAFWVTTTSSGHASTNVFLSCVCNKIK